MKVKKIYTTRDSSASFISGIIDKNVAKIANFWHRDVMTFVIGGIQEGCISLNTNNYFVQDRDFKGSTAYLFQRVFIEHNKDMGIGVNTGAFSAYLETLLANREMIKNGFGDLVSYYYFVYLSNLLKKKKLVSSTFEYLKLALSWLSFAQIDEYNYRLFKDFVERQFLIKTEIKEKAQHLIDILHGNIVNNLGHVTKEYEKVFA